MKLMNEPGDKIHMKQIATKYNRIFGAGEYVDENDNTTLAFDSKRNISDRKAGEIIGRVLHLQKLRNNQGIYLPKDGQTKLILKGLCARYGITDDLI